MLLYVCPNCGKRYQRIDVPTDEQCEICHVGLRIQSINNDANNDSSENRGASYVSRKTSSPIIKEEDTSLIEKELSSYELASSDSSSYSYVDINEKDISTDAQISGRIVSVTSNGDYRRFPIERLRDKYLYHQKVSDIQNSLTIRTVDQQGVVSDKRVIIYGQIKGGIDILRTGIRITAFGKYNNANEFMADRLVLDNNIVISIREEVGDVLYFLSPALLVVLIILLWGGISVAPGIVTGALSSIPWRVLLIAFVVIFSAVMWGLRRLIRLPLLNRLRASFFITILIEIIGAIILLNR